eukprot:CFRG2867T1
MEQTQQQGYGTYPTQPQGNSNLWCGDLRAYMNEGFIIQAFNQTGFYPHSVKIINNKTTGLPAGYCFVEFHTPAEAEAALSQMNGHQVAPQDPTNLWKLGWAQRKDQSSVGGGMVGAMGAGAGVARSEEFSIFVGELTDEVTDVSLMQFFKQHYPNCKTAKVVMGLDGRSKGYGFVRFYDRNEQLDAIARMHGAMGCGGKALRVREATPRTNREKPAMGQQNQWSGSQMYRLQQPYQIGNGGQDYDQWGQSQQWGGAHHNQHNQWSGGQAYDQAGAPLEVSGSLVATGGVAVVSQPAAVTAEDAPRNLNAQFNVVQANKEYLEAESRLLESRANAWKLPFGQAAGAI